VKTQRAYQTTVLVTAAFTKSLRSLASSSQQRRPLSETIWQQIVSRNILIIDDDRELCELVGELLRAEGFDVEFHHTGAGAVDLAASGRHALVILDVMLPEQSGFEILRALRKRSSIPVILLTARGEDVDRIVGLEIGADDYLPKPFNSRELTARINAVLRRMHPRHEDTLPRLAVGDVTLDPATRTVLKDGSAVDFTTVEFDLLHLLLSTAGTVVSREQISQRVLGRAFDPFDRSIDVHIGKVRRKLGDHASGDERIKTIRGVGFIYAQPRR
jgi:two-component system response regulator CpxR